MANMACQKCGISRDEAGKLTVITICDEHWNKVLLQQQGEFVASVMRIFGIVLTPEEISLASEIVGGLTNG